MNYYGDHLAATIQRMWPDQTLMDLQEWLQEDVIVFRHDLALSPGTEVTLNSKAIISETANTLGLAHYDADVSEPISTMDRFLRDEVTLLSHAFCEMSDVVSALGKWVLSNLDAQGQINLGEIARK
jgi:hypothetical protein